MQIKWPISIVVVITLLTGCVMEEKKDVFNWRLQSQATEKSVDFKELKKFANNVRLMSAGRLVITPYPGGDITDGADIYPAVKERRIEMGNGWPNWWVGQNPAWAVMNAGPFDFMNLDASMMFFLADEGTEIANELSLPDGVMWRPAWWPGMEFGLLSKEKINGLDDLKDKKVRIGPGLPSMVLEKASQAQVLPTVAQEIRPALENGDLDIVEWTTAGGAWSLGLNDITGYALVPAVWQPSVLSDFLINQSAYEELPADLQAILESAIRSYTLTATMKAKKQDFVAFELFQQEMKSIEKWQPEDIARWRQASDEVLNSFSDDLMSRQIITKKQAFKDKYDEYYLWFGPYDK